MLINEKLFTSSSFRAIAKSFVIRKFYLNLVSKSPTHTTIINWVHKIGYYELTKPKEKADDWIILLDHSIQLGQDKIFVILGIKESQIDFTRPLKYQDLVPLKEISKKKWNGEIICNYLEELKDEIGNIKYAVGDYGSDIKKGLRLAEINHVHDITHNIALILEKIYKKDEVYQNFAEKMSKMRVELAQTNYAYIIPPKQRKKSRYQNIKIISSWGMKALMYLENNKEIKKDVKEKLEWLKEYKVFIKELSMFNEIICKIEKITKSVGISKASIKESNQLLNQLNSPRGAVLKEKLKEYFSDTVKLLSAIKNILCTSDILESAFGKYKNYVSKNPMAGITNLVLSIAAFTSSLMSDEIKIALENTTTNNIKDWTKKYIGTTLFQQRRNAFSSG